MDTILKKEGCKKYKLNIQEVTNMHLKTKIIILMFLIVFFVYKLPYSHATIYFSYDAESGTVGSNLSQPPFCQHPCSSNPAYALGTIQSANGAPQGSKYFQWQTVNLQLEAYNEIGGQSGLPISLTMGSTYYLAYYFNFTRINGQDIWHEDIVQSADKGVELHGDGIRWTLSRGEWWTFTTPNQDHHYTVWMGNPSYHLNPSLEPFEPNLKGYSNSNPIQLDYERWYSSVMAVKIATDNTGSIALYIDGIKILEYNNIKTAASSPSSISRIIMGGTIAQPAYDAPAHYRKFDALMLTDNWQDIVDGGYLQDPNQQPDTTPPAPPSGLSVN